MPIICDVDGVVAALDVAWYARYNRDYNDKLTPDRVRSWDVHRYVKPECGEKIYEYLADPTLYDEVPVVDGALEGVEALRHLGHDVLFGSSCTIGMTDQKARWLIRHGFCEPGHGGELPRDFASIRDKSKLMGYLLIDDGPHNIKAWVATNRRALLVQRAHNLDALKSEHSLFWQWCAVAQDWEGIVRYVDQQMGGHR